MSERNVETLLGIRDASKEQAEVFGKHLQTGKVKICALVGGSANILCYDVHILSNGLLRLVWPFEYRKYDLEEGKTEIKVEIHNNELHRVPAFRIEMRTLDLPKLSENVRVEIKF